MTQAIVPESFMTTAQTTPASDFQEDWPTPLLTSGGRGLRPRFPPSKGGWCACVVVVVVCVVVVVGGRNPPQRTWTQT